MDGFGLIRDEVESVVSDPALDAGAKKRRLLSISGRLVSLAGLVSGYVGDQSLVQEAESGDHARKVLLMRANADARDALVEMGHDPDELLAQGFLSHDEIDRLAEEGLLAEAASQWPVPAEG